MSPPPGLALKATPNWRGHSRGGTGPQGKGQSPEGGGPKRCHWDRVSPPTRRCPGLPGWVLAAGGTGTTRTCHPVPRLGPRVTNSLAGPGRVREEEDGEEGLAERHQIRASSCSELKQAEDKPHARLLSPSLVTHGTQNTSSGGP